MSRFVRPAPWRSIRLGGSLPMDQDHDLRISELCELIAGEQDSTKVLWLTEELNRLLKSEEKHIKTEGDA